ncbi:unnamed protein product [Chondrus crispus]|uniref:Uncharacterized protein n=1 Tax=Chondrus crispus TaxID=2769 RepID=R7Q7H1_CHOCR|nr:unnamed protein product [Chondrus crispus]CDF33415.1 unnamed protein product [Chondrus crispus]|eukprot:XP_005713218.1 unnamed protein product [Chondrus crispus]
MLDGGMRALCRTNSYPAHMRYTSLHACSNSRMSNE